MKHSAYISQYILLFSLSVLLCSCDLNDQTTVPVAQKETKITTNLPPTSVKLEVSSDSVFVDDTVFVSCAVEDPENDSITYDWAAFKVTDNSTEGDYLLLYSLEHGEFIETGREAVWKPGFINGKYLILCNITDKAGYEVTAAKIVRVHAEGKLRMQTNKNKYTRSEFVSSDTPFVTIYNYRYPAITFLTKDGYIFGLVEEKLSDRWQKIGPFGGDCVICEAVPVQLDSAEVVSSRFGAGLWPGHYRLWLEYSIGDFFESTRDTLYSNEFEVIE